MMIRKLSILMFSLAFSCLAQDAMSPRRGDELVVTVSRFSQPVSSVLAPVSVVTRDDIDRWQAKSLSDVLRRLPGVDIAENGGRGQTISTYIRGNEARHTLILIDGIRLAKPGVVGLSQYNHIPISLVQRVEYVRGARSAVYGADAIGGVINIITQSDNEHTMLDIGIGSNQYQSYHGGMRQRLGKGTVISIAGAYEYSRGYDIKPSLIRSADQDRDGFRSKSFWAGVEQRFSSQFSGFIRGHGYANNLEHDGNYEDESDIDNHTYAIGLRFGEGRLTSQLLASYQKYKDYRYDHLQGKYQVGSSVNRVEQRNLQWGNSFQINQGMLGAGVDWLQERQTSADSRVSENHQRDNTGFYFTGQTRLESVTVEGAARADKNASFGWHETWQSAIGWELSPDHKVTVSYSTGYQVPTLGQLYGVSRLDIVSNKKLKPEESRQWELGFEGITGSIDWHLFAYRNKITNLIAYDVKPVTEKGYYYNVNSVTLKGIEWHMAFDTGIFQHGITLEYLDPRRDKDNEVLGRRAKYKAKYQLDWEMLGLDVDLIYQYYGKRFDNNTSQWNALQHRLPGYSTVDIAASYPITSELTVRGRIANLFNKDYVTAYGYKTAGREYFLTASYTF